MLPLHTMMVHLALRLKNSLAAENFLNTNENVLQELQKIRPSSQGDKNQSSTEQIQKWLNLQLATCNRSRSGVAKINQSCEVVFTGERIWMSQVDPFFFRRVSSQ